MSNRFICIHGHFYQPPRENPWLEMIDRQDLAAPYHDWNARISAECYRPNGMSRILDSEGRVVRLSNNYSRMSFNFGPTLLSWMEEHDRDAYEAVLEGDRISRTRFGGHGAAIAQCYNHMIMPLANRRDKVTQVKWGLRDFEARFARAAEAMWLPETAVDMETLEIMADHGLRYVILAPRQAQAVRPLNGDHLWESARGERIDTRMPYLIRLPGGGEIAAFFYNGELSRAVAFEGLLNNGDHFAARLGSGFAPAPEAQLVHIATDGESYGHHHAKGDMALAYALEQIGQRKIATLTNYGQYLEMFPPTHEARIYEDSSWSCIHGIERWRRDCGCNSGGRPEWNQKWRTPLRAAMDDLRDRLAPCFEDGARAYTDRPWEMRNAYITLIQDRSAASRDAFIKVWAGRDLPASQAADLLRLLEMQRHLMLMYTSCAWFFDEISGVETVQALAYAARAIELAQPHCEDAEERFLDILQQARPNMADFADGRAVYDRLVRGMRVDIMKAAANLVARALFDRHAEEDGFACFEAQWGDVRRVHSGRAQLIVAHLTLTSRMTTDWQAMECAALHLGDHHINTGVLPYGGAADFDKMAAAFETAFENGDFTATLKLLDTYFDGHILSLSDLFHEQQVRIAGHVFAQTLESLEDQFTAIYDQHYAIMNYLSHIHITLPQVFSHIAHFVQNKHIQKQLAATPVDIAEIERYVAEAEKWDVELDRAAIATLYVAALRRALDVYADGRSPDSLQDFAALLALRDVFPFAVDLGDVQTAFARLAYAAGDAADGPEWAAISRALNVNLTGHGHG